MSKQYSTLARKEATGGWCKGCAGRHSGSFPANEVRNPLYSPFWLRHLPPTGGSLCPNNQSSGLIAGAPCSPFCRLRAIFPRPGEVFAGHLLGKLPSRLQGNGSLACSKIAPALFPGWVLWYTKAVEWPFFQTIHSNFTEFSKYRIMISSDHPVKSFKRGGNLRWQKF